MATINEERYVTLALAGLLNRISESDLVHFFASEVRCSDKEVASAIGDAKVLMRQSDRWNSTRALTVPMIRQIVEEFLGERNRRFCEANDNNPQFTAYLQVIAKTLEKGEFIVRITQDYESRSTTSEHDLIKGDLFVITAKQSLKDGTRDEWFCGYNVNDATKTLKWLFSDMAQVVYPR